MAIHVISDSKTVSKDECYNQIMFEIQKCMVEIDTNREKRRSIQDDVASMAALIGKLSEIENVDDILIGDKREAFDKQFQ